MFKARRSANDQICVVFQVTRGYRSAPAQLRSKDCCLGRIFPCQDGSYPSLFSTLADGVIQQQLYPAGQKVKWREEKRSNLEHKRTIVGLGTCHGSLSKHGVIELMSYVYMGFRRLHVETKKNRQGIRILCLPEQTGSCTPSILPTTAPETASSLPFLCSSLSSHHFLIKSLANFPNREFALI